VETTFRDREVEPSQGAHFFHNVTSFQIGYLTVRGGVTRPAEGEDVFDVSWLLGQPVAEDLPEVVHVRLEQPLRVLLDGRRSRGVILKPGYDRTTRTNLVAPPPA